MWSLLLVAVVSLLVWTWVKGTRANRAKWLNSLNLPGLWHWETEDAYTGSLEMWGSVAEGGYRMRDGEPGAMFEQKGSWRVEGHSLIFEPDAGATEVYDLRLFEPGRIGLHSPRHPDRVYVKARNNVISLGSRRK